MKWRETDHDNPIIEFLTQHAATNNTVTLKEQAAVFDCSTQYLCDVYAGRRSPGPTMLNKLGVVKEVNVTYRWRKEDV